MHAAINCENLAERPEIAIDGNAIAVVQCNEIVFDDAGHRYTLDQQIQRIGYDFSKTPDIVFCNRFWWNGHALTPHLKAAC